MVPAFNEELYLLDAVNSIVRAGQIENIELDIIIVNDGSRDNTQDIINDLEKKYEFVRSIHNVRNLGMGTSLLKVIKIAKGEKFLILPGDGDISEGDIIKMFANMNKAEMVFLYYLNKEMRGRFRNVISLLYNAIHIMVFDIYVQYISGPCIYPMKKMKELKLKSKRLSIAAEISIKLLSLGCTYCEVSGHMQKGKIGSNAISINNLLEVSISFLKLLIEIKIKKRRLYNKVPVRAQ